jgi:hypothetical protein
VRSGAWQASATADCSNPSRDAYIVFKPLPAKEAVIASIRSAFFALIGLAVGDQFREATKLMFSVG